MIHSKALITKIVISYKYCQKCSLFSNPKGRTSSFPLTLFDIGFFEPSVMRGGGGGALGPPHHNFVVIAPMIMKFGTGIKLNLFYTMVANRFVMSLLLRKYDVIACILADA